MPQPEPTEIRINEHGDESHESWLLVRANHVSCHPGAKLFDSEIRHQHYIQVTVTRCTRKRDLNRDWLFATKTLIEFDMSQSQWGAFVSSFGNGGGVPATLSWFDDMVPGVSTNDSRLGKSHDEVKNAHAEGLRKIKDAEAAVQEAFEKKLGIKETRARLATLHRVIDYMPGNMEYAAKSLTEHVENVVTKARADIEGMITGAAVDRQIEGATLFELPSA